MSCASCSTIPSASVILGFPSRKRRQPELSFAVLRARLIIHRYAMLGILDEEGYPVRRWECSTCRSRRRPEDEGLKCNECGNFTVIRKDGCDFCSAAGAVGVCGDGARTCRLRRGIA